MHRFSHLMLAIIFPLLFTNIALGTTPGKPGAPSGAPQATNPETEPEQWKGKPYDNVFQLSLLAGIGVVGSAGGFGLNAAAAFKILHQGFLDGINDQAYLEIIAGPLFLGGGVTGFYGAHLRWDFHKNEIWTFYATGGLGGNFSGAVLGNTGMIYPRFGIGTLWNLFQFLSFRAELSHEFMGIGVMYLL